MAEADPVHAIFHSGGLRLSKRTRGPSETTVPILLRSQSAPAPSEQVALTSIPENVPPSATNPPELAEVASPTVAPPTSTGTTSLRRVAKLTDLARIITPPAPSVTETPPVPPSVASAAVVPPSFPVPSPTPEPPPLKEPSSIEPPIVSKNETKMEAPTPTPQAEQKLPPSSAVPLKHFGSPAISPEKREFHLANGERIVGKVLSETADTIYVEHGTLGVLTLPRAQIAQRLVEIILINGDRIVGDIMAETPDTLYVRHASLGMLTVPRAQRSTRVVEAILKDGDRILGEVLAETDKFTVIRSATLGTISMPHDKVTMINRKIEQIELKALPPSAPELKDKSSG